MNRFILFAILGAMVLGVVVGAAIHQMTTPEMASEIAGYLKLITSGVFLPLIKMIIAPLIISTLTVGIAHLGGGGALGRIGLQTMAWFLTASLVSLSLGLLLVNLLKPGVGFSIALPPGAENAVASVAFNFKDFLAHVIPSSVTEAMAKNEVLQIVVFSIFLGVALQALGAKTAKVTELLEQVAFVMLKITGYVMALAPLAVFAAMATAIAVNGLDVIVDYSRLVGSFFLGLFILWALLVTAGFIVLGPKVFRLMGAIRTPALIAFSTASSEAAYPKLLEQLERFGIANRVVSFVLPLGYSFNLDGSMMYCTFAIMFIAQVLGVDLSLTQQIVMLLLLLVTSKGIAGVPRASLVVIAAALPTFGLPPEAIGLVLAVDAFMDMGRTATNVIGNSIACAVVAKWEGLLSEPSEDTPVIEQVLGAGESAASHSAAPHSHAH
jgi:Na+/H+-dicarboxylate symporter